MNIITNLIARIEEYRATNKSPCKSYATEATAEKATALMSEFVGSYFTRAGDTPVSAQYLVFYCPGWGKWVGAINLSEVLRRPNCTGGYLGVAKGFYTF